MSQSETIRIMCPNLKCRKILAVPTSARGKTVRCKGCQTNIRVPDGTEVSADAAAKAKSQSNAA